MSTTSETFALAMRHHAAGNLDAAETLYEQVLQADLNNAECFHFLGALAYTKGHFDRAIELIGRALALKPGAADCHLNMGLAHQALGQLHDAYKHYHESVRIRPDSCKAQVCLGNALVRRQDADGAMACFQRALRLDPHDAAAYNGMGLALDKQNQLDEAIRRFQQALQINPDFAEAYYNWGNTLKRQDKLEEAIGCFRQALRIKPDLAEASNNLGGTLARQGKLELAADWFRTALRINPNLVEAYNGLGHAYERQEKVDEAVRCYRQALQLQPDNADAHLGLGCALERQKEMTQAIACFREAVRLNPISAEAHNNLAAALWYTGHLDEALAGFEQAIRLRPNYAKARISRAVGWLLRGEFERGWREYVWRWTLPWLDYKASPSSTTEDLATVERCRQDPDLARRHFDQPEWDGSDLAGRTILLHAEQGLGDTIQFIRYHALVRERGGNPIVECQPLLIALLSLGSQFQPLLAKGSALPEFDVQASLLSLPGIFHTDLATIPGQVPYLRADTKLVEHWRRVLAPLPGIKIGIAWQGNTAFAGDFHRSIPLACFAPLAQIEGVRLISLQKSYQPEPGGAEMVVKHFGGLDEGAGAFMDTAAIMMNVDVVVTSDTAVAHLAGALAVPVWLALPLIPDWRWQLERRDSPWYPSMRLFRQSRFGQWSDVFERMAGELVNKGHPACLP